MINRRSTILKYAALASGGLLLISACGGGDSDDDGKTAITMYYPIQVGGDLESLMNEFIEEFESQNDDISVEAVYSGNYDDTIVQTTAAVAAGEPPAVSVMQASNLYEFIDQDLIAPIDENLENEEDKEWINSFYDAFMMNATDSEGTVWGVPFQRSTNIQFYNKDAFDDAGLDPEDPPKTWEELEEKAEQVQEGSDVDWGIELGTSELDGNWLFQGLTYGNGQGLANDEGTQTYFDDPAVVEALEYWIDLDVERGVHPSGSIDFGTTGQDFTQGKIGITWNTSGNLVSFEEDADFEVGVSEVPGNPEQRGSTGGGNLYLFEDASDAEKEAGMKLIRFLTEPEQLAAWSIATGYVAPSPETWETDEMQEHIEEHPNVSILQDAVEAAGKEMSVYQYGEVRKLMDDALQAAHAGEGTPADLLSDAQQKSDQLLEPYQ